MKYIVIGLVIYFVYKFMLPPSLKEPAKQDNLYEKEAEKAPKKQNFEEEYTDYEEID